VIRHLHITGTGLITPLGTSVEQTWHALLAGDFIRNHTRCSTGNSPVPEAPRVSQLALIAAREAIGGARWSRRHLANATTALVVGTSKGPVVEWTTAPPVTDYRTNKVSGQCMGLHEIGETLARELGLAEGPRLTYSAACASGLHALIHAAMLLESGRADRALVVAAEASVHPLFVSSFRRLGVLPSEGFGCRPFDADRCGFLMSESAAAICLERSDSVRPDLAHAGSAQAGCDVLVDRFALGADATHLTGVDPTGTTLRRLLARVIDRRPVDLVHAHATGTRLNDPIELAAIEEQIADGQIADIRPTWIYSHKGALGHSLGAAGLISVVLNVESHRRGIILPNVQTRNPIERRRGLLGREPAKTDVRRSIAIASGFGGPIAVISCVSA
jgi:3-oxoacyl-[acyl-carrier-protein] synthase II